MMNFKNKRVAVLGLGIEGKDAIFYLLSNGANVTLLDRKSELELDFNGVEKEKINVITGENYLSDLSNYDFIVRSPGVYRYMPEIVNAEKNGVIITSAIKIFLENVQGKVIGVTGTKGKGTTSTLIYEILKTAGFDVYLSGNIGKPYLSLLPVLNKKSFTILELSSFQLIDIGKSPNISVVLNITQDHMDWHKSRKEYIDAKTNIVSHQTAFDWAVINKEYKTPFSFVEKTKANVILFSKEVLEPNYKNNIILRGEHNLENIAAAVTVAKILNINEETIAKVVKSFKGLEHRLEFVKEVDGIKFYNDSFATGPDATIAAVKSFTEPETLILGGSDKGLDYASLGKVINSKTNIRNIILIGQTASKIKRELNKDLGFKIYELGTKVSMDEIVMKAYQISEKDSVVILSPASASFDMFKNYKDRGNKFKEAVASLQL